MGTHMMSYSQNKEDLIVLDYFKGKKGTVLEIGANDGITLSNSRLLIQMGWKAVLIEPSPTAYAKLVKLYPNGKQAKCYSYGIGTQTNAVKFYESGAHLPHKQDVALLSGTSIQEDWKHLDYHELEVPFLCFGDHWGLHGADAYDFISIDAEGSDWDILQQIDLKEVGCKCLCIEHNSKPILHGLYTNYVKKFGFKETHINAENVIFAI